MGILNIKITFNKLYQLTSVTASNRKSNIQTGIIPLKKEQELRERIAVNLFRLRHSRQHKSCPASLERR